jgi:hypothetical protein
MDAEQVINFLGSDKGPVQAITLSSAQNRLRVQEVRLARGRQQQGGDGLDLQWAAHRGGRWGPSRCDELPRAYPETTSNSSHHRLKLIDTTGAPQMHWISSWR